MKKNALITGGASGLGKELCELMISNDYLVHIIDKTPKYKVSPDYLQQLTSYHELDLSDLDQVKDFCSQKIQNTGLDIDLLILNASPRIFKKLEEYDDNLLIGISNASFVSQLLLLKYILNGMTQKGEGTIIIIGSKTSVQGFSTGSLYTAYKAGWIVFTESLAKELKQANQGVSVSIICPDSFSDLDGSRLNHYEHTVRKVKRLILNTIRHKNSEVRYAILLKTRLVIILQYFNKMIRLITYK